MKRVFPQVDKDFTYRVIEELRAVASKKEQGNYDKTLMLGAANVMETNIRAYMDLFESTQRPDPLGDALNSGDGTYRP